MGTGAKCANPDLLVDDRSRPLFLEPQQHRLQGAALPIPGSTRRNARPRSSDRYPHRFCNHGRFRKLRSKSVDNKIGKPRCWHSSPPSALGSAGSQRLNCRSANCSEESSVCAEVRGQNVNQRLRTSISACDYLIGATCPIPAPPRTSTYAGVTQMSQTITSTFCAQRSPIPNVHFEFHLHAMS